MPLSWNEIKQRALAFGNEWKNETREAAERQSFRNDFFKIFDIKRRTVAGFDLELSPAQRVCVAGASG